MCACSCTVRSYKSDAREGGGVQALQNGNRTTPLAAVSKVCHSGGGTGSGVSGSEWEPQWDDEPPLDTRAHPTPRVHPRPRTPPPALPHSAAGRLLRIFALGWCLSSCERCIRAIFCIAFSSNTAGMRSLIVEARLYAPNLPSYPLSRSSSDLRPQYKLWASQIISISHPSFLTTPFSSRVFSAEPEMEVAADPSQMPDRPAPSEVTGVEGMPLEAHMPPLASPPGPSPPTTPADLAAEAAPLKAVAAAEVPQPQTPRQATDVHYASSFASPQEGGAYGGQPIPTAYIQPHDIRGSSFEPPYSYSQDTHGDSYPAASHGFVATTQGVAQGLQGLSSAQGIWNSVHSAQPAPVAQQFIQDPSQHALQYLQQPAVQDYGMAPPQEWQPTAVASAYCAPAIAAGGGGADDEGVDDLMALLMS